LLLNKCIDSYRQAWSNQFFPCISQLVIGSLHAQLHQRPPQELRPKFNRLARRKLLSQDIILLEKAQRRLLSEDIILLAKAHAKADHHACATGQCEGALD